MSVKIEKVCTNSFEMKYFKFGGGRRNFVILPGLSIVSVMNYADSIRNQYSEMEKDFTVYVFDRRTEIPSGYSIKGMAEDTIIAIKALGLTDIYLFGASQGGMIAMEIAIDAPALVKRLVLGNTSAEINSLQYKTIEGWAKYAESGDAEGLYTNLWRKIYPENIFESVKGLLPEMIKQVTDADLKQFVIKAGAIRDFNVKTQLKQIRCPVYATGSADDEVLGPDSIYTIIDSLIDNPNFEYHIYNGYGHAAFDTAPDYLERMLKFLLK